MLEEQVSRPGSRTSVMATISPNTSKTLAIKNPGRAPVAENVLSLERFGFLGVIKGAS